MILIICILIVFFFFVFFEFLIKIYTYKSYKTDNNSYSTEKIQNNSNSNDFKLKNIKYIPNSLNYKSYSVKATYIATNRKRTVRIDCHKDEDLNALIQKQGFKPPFEIEENLPPAPTEKQLEYANDVIENLPPNLNIYDISALLDRYQQGDFKPPNPELIEFADGRKFTFSYYIGEKNLYNLIFKNLNSLDKIAFATFSAYRYLADSSNENLDTSPLKSYFYNFASQYVNNENFLTSILLYKGEEFCFSGKGHIGTKIYTGKNPNTKGYSYKIIAEYLHNTFNTPLTKTKIL